MGDTANSDSCSDNSRDFGCNRAKNSNSPHNGNSQLKILTLNVCGLSSKLQIPEFIDLINCYDIIGIQESKTDDCDDIHIPGYSITYNNRQELSRRKSGGIVLLIKNEIQKYIKIDTKQDSKLVQWFSISGVISPTNETISCGVVYIPPYGSRYAHEDPYVELQREILRFCNNSKNLILMGDFNSRTGEKDDFQEIDTFISDKYGLETLRDETQEMFNCLLQSNISLERSNCDKCINHYGSQMLEFCKTVDLFILNGRIFDRDKSSNFTCKGCSTVDYFLSTANLFSAMTFLEVLEFSNLVSDVHCPVALDIQTKYALPSYKPDYCKSDNIKTKLWNNDNSSQFEANIDFIHLSEILSKLSIFCEQNEIEQIEMDDIVADIGCLFENGAKKTFGCIKQKSDLNQPVNKKKPWFNTECRNARNQYHNARKFYNKNKSEETKLYFKRISKDYKKTLLLNAKRFKQSRIEKLRRLKTSNSKEYWKILNSSNEKAQTKAPLNDLYNFFKDINSQSNDQAGANMDTDVNDTVNAEINQPITESEILKAIKQLNNDKSPGIDNIKNEHIKSTCTLMLPIYIKLFNLVFDKGVIPESWSVGVIKPIYKKKGDPTMPENYRPITILSCLGKLFTLIINNRLKIFAEKYNVIEENQAGFRKNHSTSDNLFIIKSLIDIAKANKNKLFCCCIDFKQAFDTVWRQGLWYKLNQYSINGKCLTLIQNMYENIKSKVMLNNESSAYFPCLTGVRQGENLSPFLFSIYLNDLNHYLMSNNVNGITCEVNSNDIYMYLKILLLLYADDTILFSNTAADMQHSLDVFRLYCDKWKLTVNASKTKIIIFANGRRRTYNFKFGDSNLETVKEYKYLGINLAQSGSFCKAKKSVAEQANKALFSLLKKARSLNLPYEIQLELFDKTIKPILLYGAEIWGYGDCSVIERVHLKFLKYLFNLKKSTPSYMIYGELGIFPITIDIQLRNLSFWCKLIENLHNENLGQQKLSSLIYAMIYHMQLKNEIKSDWLNNVKNLLSSLGFSGIWDNQNFDNHKWLIASLKEKLRDQYIQKWLSLTNASSSSNNYRLYKSEFKKSDYFSLLSDTMCRNFLAFRSRNHRLPVETGRWLSVAHNDRKCPLCKEDIGDEFHYIMACKHFFNLRKQYIKPYFYRHPNVLKYEALMNTRNTNQLKNLCTFIQKMLKEVQ